jgi:hypothetical protein
MRFQGRSCRVTSPPETPSLKRLMTALAYKVHPHYAYFQDPDASVACVCVRCLITGNRSHHEAGLHNPAVEHVSRGTVASPPCPSSFLQHREGTRMMNGLPAKSS